MKTAGTATLIYVLSIFLGGCDEARKNGHPPVQNYSVSYIEKPAGGTTFSLGEPIEIVLKLRSVPEDLKSAFIMVDDSVYYSSSEKKDNYSFIFTDSSMEMGTHVIRTKIELKEKTEEQRTTITIVSNKAPVNYTYDIVNTFRHDPQAYTQGLIIDNGIMYEGTGLQGQSDIRVVNLFTGEFTTKYKLDDQYFGEGITIIGDKLYQLTYQHRIGFIYDKNTFEKTGEFSYNSEGWGLTHDGNHLIMSDGTNKLYFIDPEKMTIAKTLEVYDNRGPQHYLNELEYINGEIWANVYQTETIVVIDPSNGQIKSRINLSGIIEWEGDMDVLNGIAYDQRTGKIYVTGKRWPKIFEIKISEAEV